jgi:nucleotide-binding universal stress UspA family protein
MRKTAVIVGLIIGITALHYFTTFSKTHLHVIYRELYFIPIILAGLWKGRRGGLITSIVASLLFLPHFFFPGKPYDFTVSSVFELLLFNVTGFLAGSFRDARQGYISTKSKPYHPTQFKKNFLLYVDGTSSSLYAANYFADIFGTIPDIKATLLWISPEEDPDCFTSPEDAATRGEDISKQGETSLNQAREILLRGGIAESNIQLKSLRKDRGSKTSDTIKKELERSNYDTVVLGKRDFTKPQEFLFGSVTISLVREAPVNVMSIKPPKTMETDNVAPQTGKDQL